MVGTSWRCKNIEEAVALVEHARPQVILNAATIQQLNNWYADYHISRVNNEYIDE